MNAQASNNAQWTEANWNEYQALKAADAARKDKVREQGKRWRDSQKAAIDEARRIVDEYKRAQAGLNKSNK
jgi:hypothetical protein